MEGSSLFSMLVVEDEKDARDLLCSILNRKYPDMILHVAENGVKGLEIFKEHLPEIVITDISMPQMDGIQLAAEIKSLNPHTIIIAITAHTSAKSLLDSNKKGVNHYIQKPIIYSKLFVTLDTCISSLEG